MKNIPVLYRPEPDPLGRRPPPQCGRETPVEALRDAIEGADAAAVTSAGRQVPEVQAREKSRHRSCVSPVARRFGTGFGLRADRFAVGLPLRPAGPAAADPKATATAAP